MTEEDSGQGQESSVTHEFDVTGSKPSTQNPQSSSRNMGTIHSPCIYPCSSPRAYIGGCGPTGGPDPLENLLRFMFPESEVGRKMKRQCSF